MTTTGSVSGSSTTTNWNTSSSTKTSDKASTTDTTDTSTTSTTDTAIKGLGDNFNTFLKLLTTQMTNQDPTKPMDTNEMTQQLVQFAGIEQSIGTNSRLDKLLKMQQSATASSNLGYLGKTVSFEGDAFQLTSTTTVTPMSYELDKEAKSVSIKIMDSKGATVRTIDGDATAGKHEISWDYKDSSGNTVPTGSYTFSVAPTAVDKDTVITAKTYTFGTVSGVGNKDGETTLSVNGKDIALSNISSVE